MQVKLLRTLQEKRVRRVGGTVEEEVDVRIIAATNRNLEALIEEKVFREDLYYRINVIPVHLPPLRNRREDIPLLVDFFIKKCGEEIGVEPKQILTDAMNILEAYRWPGNVRELENLISRALTLCRGEAITVEDLPPRLLRPAGSESRSTALPEDGLALEAHLDDIRRSLMLQALERCGGVQTQAAELLDMSFRSFRYYSKKMSLGGENPAGPEPESTSAKEVEEA
jgi:two-component system response regulator PilR (NtrC family)